jgi:hypothetical protein
VFVHQVPGRNPLREVDADAPQVEYRLYSRDRDDTRRARRGWQGPWLASEEDLPAVRAYLGSRGDTRTEFRLVRLDRAVVDQLDTGCGLLLLPGARETVSALMLVERRAGIVVGQSGASRHLRPARDRGCCHSAAPVGLVC